MPIPSWLYQTPSLSDGPQQVPMQQPAPQPVMPSWAQTQPPPVDPSWLSPNVQQSDGWPVMPPQQQQQPLSQYPLHYTEMGGQQIGLQAPPEGYEWDMSQTVNDGSPVLKKIGAQPGALNIFGQSDDPIIRDSYKLFSDYDPRDPNRVNPSVGSDRWRATQQVDSSQQGALAQMLMALFGNQSPIANSRNYQALTPQQRRTMG